MYKIRRKTEGTNTNRIVATNPNSLTCILITLPKRSENQYSSGYHYNYQLSMLLLLAARNGGERKFPIPTGMTAIALAKKRGEMPVRLSPQPFSIFLSQDFTGRDRDLGSVKRVPSHNPVCRSLVVVPIRGRLR